MRIGEHGALTSQHLDGFPVALALGTGILWVAERDRNEVVALDTGSLKEVARVAVPVPVSVTAGPLGIWALSVDTASLYQLDPQRKAAVRRLDSPVASPIEMVEAGGEMWILGAGEEGVSPVNTALGRIVRAGFNRAGEALSGLSAADGTIWLAEPSAGSLLSVETSGVRARRFTAPVGMQPVATGAGGCGQWVAAANGSVTVIDPTSGTQLAPALRIGRSASALAPAGTGAWVSDPGDGTLVRVEISPSR
jgi:hypothetical protein